jgi:nuclear pore complex protein Nup133
MEHGEKLAGMLQLRELHNSWAQARMQNSSSEVPENIEVGGALWETVQLVGEKARRNNVMLMDREKSEVFYVRVSDLEEYFSCIQQHANAIVGREHPLRVQIERLCELAESSTSLIRAAIRYRDTQQSWYPSPEGLTPWYCRPTVRSGVWKVASMLLDLRGETSVSVPSMEPLLNSWLEEVADVLLEGYAGAITAKVEREEEYRGLQMEYWSRRDSILATLQQQARAVADSSVQVPISLEIFWGLFYLCFICCSSVNAQCCVGRRNFVCI